MSNETKQTAVDKIVNLLNKKGFAPVLTEEEIKFFKEMEKEQMIQFAIKCMFNSDDIGSNLKNHFIKKYNEEFGGNK
jgi:hypothetical protein